MRPLSADEVLAIVIRMLTRYRDEPTELTAATTIASVLDLCLTRYGRFLCRPRRHLEEFCDGLNEFFAVAISQDQYDRALYPITERTLGDLCAIIATQATVPVIDPPEPEQVFHALRGALADAGANVADLTPSTPVSRYAVRRWRAVDAMLLRITAGTIPIMKMEVVGRARTFVRWMGIGFVASWILGFACFVPMLAGLPFGVPWPFVAFVAAGVLCLALLIPALIVGGPMSLQPQNLSTFDDLCRYVVPYLSRPGSSQE